MVWVVHGVVEVQGVVRTDRDQRAEVLGCLWGETFGERQVDARLLQEWLDDDEHLCSTLLLLGPGQLGKSKLLHQLCQELTIAEACKLYVYGKAIEPLGVLSHSGVLRSAAALALTDFDFAAARGVLGVPRVITPSRSV